MILRYILARPRCEWYADVPFSAGGGSGGSGKSAAKGSKWGKSSGKGKGWRLGGDDSDGDGADEDDGGKLYIKVCVLEALVVFVASRVTPAARSTLS